MNGEDRNLILSLLAIIFVASSSIVGIWAVSNLMGEYIKNLKEPTKQILYFDAPILGKEHKPILWWESYRFITKYGVRDVNATDYYSYNVGDIYSWTETRITYS